ncbi:MAG: glutathione S-transferase family protein [Alphaproteobacteria bacterium]|nr:glutathione S-transferase family protein [Alphaproteobacteria bacterium]
MTDMTLVIGDRNISSWSLRPWLALKMAGAAFSEETIHLRRPETKAEIALHSPSGKVPLLRHGTLTVWESLSICEYAAEIFPDAGLWPEDRAARAVARAVSCEMHAGFSSLRQNMPMDVRSRKPGEGMTPEVAHDIARITSLWSDCHARFGGGGRFLFGHFTIADAMYAPVVTRFATYGVALDPFPTAYVEAIQSLPAMQEWAAKAISE